MMAFFKNRSFRLYSVALITPLIAWFVLFSLAKKSTNAFDPSPWIQDFVDQPGQILSTAPLSTGPLSSTDKHWLSLVAKNEELQIQHGEQLTPLREASLPQGFLILLVEAQGPRFAKQLFDFLKEHDGLQRSLVLSVSDGFLKDVRYYHRDVALGAGQAYVVRFRALQTLALENFLVINMSGVWLRPEIFKESTSGLTDTFINRKVPVFIGPVSRDQISSLPQNANYLVTD